MERTIQNRIDQEQKRFEEYLASAGLDLSSGRRKVFATVMGTHGHFAAEEIVKICKQKNVRVSRATVYRCLHELREAGVIRETAFGEKHQHFEHVYDEQLHHHARCIHCHRVIEFPCTKCNHEYSEFLENRKFEILGHEVHYYGICNRCKSKRETINSN